MQKIKIFSGLLGALFSLWLAGVWFCDSPYILVPHPEIGGVGFPENSTIVWRSEGKGRSYYGKWGISAIADIRSCGPQKILFWGDSYVQAAQVDDEEKMAQKTTHLLRHAASDYVAVGLGLAGSSMPDYLYRIPNYEKMIPNIVAHVIIVGQLEDFLPNNPSARYSKFIEDLDGLRIKQYASQRPSRMKWNIYKWGTTLKANGILSVARKTVNSSGLRFHMGPVHHCSDGANNALKWKRATAYFEYFAQEFRRQTDKKLILVYLPTVPRIENNGIAMEDSDTELALRMEEIFTQYGWTVINMQESFTNHFMETGALPRGFSNSRPGLGHLNETGNKLVAEAIVGLFLR